MYASLEKLGAKPSRLGFGLMRLPLAKDGRIDRPAALAMVDKAYQNGVNYFDTAYAYHDGESELFAAEALSRYPRDSFQLATKLPTWLVQSYEDVGRLFSEQLEKCGVEYFDVYLIHSLDKNRWPVIREVKAYEQLLQKKKEGKIRFLGFSYHGDFDTFREIIDTYEWDFVQIQTNYLDARMIEAEQYHDLLTRKGIACIVMEPVRGGFLARLPDAAKRELNAVNGDSQVKWAFRWCLGHENTPIILSGMSDMAQVEENLEIFSEQIPFTAEEQAALGRAVEKILAIRTVPCTACRYCMDCDFGVDIPGIFGTYNEYKLFGDKERLRLRLQELGDAHSASVCTSCAVCAPKCPQGIEIPGRLAEVHEAIGKIVG